MLEIDSLKERSLRFMDHLLKQKEAIELQFQISEKFSEKANKHYRETVLRDFFTKNRAYVLSKGNQRFIIKVKIRMNEKALTCLTPEGKNALMSFYSINHGKRPIWKNLFKCFLRFF